MNDASTENAHSKIFSLKELIIFIPVLGSAFAISYEAGSFLATSDTAFGLFSVTEHIGFALSVFPIAVFVLLLCFPYAMMIRIVVRRLQSSKLHASMELRTAGVGFLLAAVLMGAVGINMRLPPLLALAFGLACAASVLLIEPLLILRSPIIIAFWSVGFALLTTFSIGLESTRMLLIDSHSSDEITVEEGPKKVTVLRAGEKGILFYDSSSGNFEYRRWESVKKVTWRRIGLWERVSASFSVLRQGR